MSDQAHIEAKLRRMSGMSVEKREAMHTYNNTQQWRVRCWNCRTWNEGIRSDLKTCSNCGKNLWSRDE